jgi:phage shock protein PspC (stress-responsive transcriptional regulator)
MAEEEKDSERQTDQTDAAPAPRRLLRSSKDRMLWGVAGGLGEYLRVDPTLVRLGFVVATFFGGFGLLAYLVMAVVVPEDGDTGQPRTGRRAPTWAIVLLAIAVLIAIPGPLFWGFGHGWHGGSWGWWFGPLWIVLLVAVAIIAVRAIRGRPPRWLRGDRGEAASAEATTADTGEAPTAEVKATGETGETKIRGGETPRWLRLIAIVLLACAAICAALMVGAGAAWATATGSGSVVAGVVIALGIAIGATAFIGEASRIAPWLLASALVLAVPAGATAAADIHFDGGIGERNYRPVALTDLPADGYDFGVGQMTVDLRDLPWTNSQTISVSSKLGVGQMIVSVPTRVCVQAHATGKAGELLVRGDQSDGIDPEIDQGQPRSQAPRLLLDAEIQLGQLIVTDEAPAAITEHGVDYDHNRLSAESQRQVCGP